MLIYNGNIVLISVWQQQTNSITASSAASFTQVNEKVRVLEEVHLTTFAGNKTDSLWDVESGEVIAQIQWEMCPSGS